MSIKIGWVTKEELEKRSLAERDARQKKENERRISAYFTTSSCSSAGCSFSSGERANLATMMAYNGN